MVTSALEFLQYLILPCINDIEKYMGICSEDGFEVYYRWINFKGKLHSLSLPAEVICNFDKEVQKNMVS